MYANLHEITFVHREKYRPNPNGDPDLPIYERGLNSNRVFTFDAMPSKYDTMPPRRYGVGYIRPDGQLCVVPDVWDDTDAFIGHNSVMPDPAWVQPHVTLYHLYNDTRRDEKIACKSLGHAIEFLQERPDNEAVVSVVYENGAVVFVRNWAQDKGIEQLRPTWRVA